MNWYVVKKIKPMNAYDLVGEVQNFEIDDNNSSNIEVICIDQNPDCVRDKEEDIIVNTWYAGYVIVKVILFMFYYIILILLYIHSLFHNLFECLFYHLFVLILQLYM